MYSKSNRILNQTVNGLIVANNQSLNKKLKKSYRYLENLKAGNAKEPIIQGVPRQQRDPVNLVPNVLS